MCKTAIALTAALCLGMTGCTMVTDLNTAGENAPTASPAANGKGTISKAAYDSIQTGMSYDEVRSIVGSDGELLSEIGMEEDPFYSIIYFWSGQGVLGANANVTFQDGEVISKAQYGLQ